MGWRKAGIGRKSVATNTEGLGLGKPGDTLLLRMNIYSGPKGKGLKGRK